MSPNPNQDEYVLYENEYEEILQSKLSKENTKSDQKRKYRWSYIIFFTIFHIQAIYGIYLMITSAKLLTTAFAFVLYLGTSFSVTAGAHRLWTHRAFKAKWQLKLLLLILHTVALQETLYRWILYHRLHHKYTDTNADPHNSKRGLFFSHIGWLLIEPHPDQIDKTKTIDMSDIKSDTFIRFQIRYYYRMLLLFWAFLPTVIPWYFWNETLTNSWFIAVSLRFIFQLHVTFLVNSWAHLWGNQPYDTITSARETLFVSIMTLGEGWHNYHHAFPWDYRASELGGGRINVTTFVLKNIFGKIGWAYDFKTVSDDMIQKRIARTGDGSHSPTIWGWGDRDQTEENKTFAIIEKF